MNPFQLVVKNERGAVSILFALLLFSIFAVIGILADLGLARTTQGIMQIATDGSSLEGLRLRDDIGTNEIDRRAAVAINAARNFSHQVQGDTVEFPDDDRQFGAGSMINLDAGAGAERASQLVTLPQNNQYLPELELNLGNLEHGDMVSGDYDLTAIHTAGALVDPAHDETGVYVRTGFTPDVAAPFDGNAFLVRMRRTPNPDGLDDLAGISSSGPPLPFLFTRGAAIKYDETYDIGADGLSVRATSIALARPAKTVGRFQAGMMGVTPFVITRAFWDSVLLAAGVESLTVSISVEADGRIIDPNLGVVVGRFIFADANNAIPISVGMIAGVAVAPAAVAAIPVNGYVPVVDNLAGNDFIIGFGRVQVTLNDADGNPPYDALFTKFSSRVASENASASVQNGFNGLDIATIEFLLDSNQTQGAQFSDPLLAPALVR